MHVDPISPPEEKLKDPENTLKSLSFQNKTGGGAGYRPRVRFTYCARRLSP